MAERGRLSSTAEGRHASSGRVSGLNVPSRANISSRPCEPQHRLKSPRRRRDASFPVATTFAAPGVIPALVVLESDPAVAPSVITGAAIIVLLRQ